MLVLLLILLNLATILFVATVRYSPLEFQFILPWRQAMQPPGWLPAALGGLILILGLVTWRLARWRQVARPLVELMLYYPLLFTAIWGFVPDRGFRLETAGIGLLLLVVAGYLIARGGRGGIGLGLGRAGFRAAGRRLFWPTLVIVVGFTAWALLTGRTWRGGALAYNLVMYPLYALGQMLLFLVLPVPRLRRLTAFRWWWVTGCAVLFAMVHWPNPVVMAVCLAGMIYWATVYLLSPNVWAVALSMGITATFFVQLVPENITQHVRVGPGYVRGREITVLGNRPVFSAGENPAEPAPQAGTEPLIPDSVVADFLRAVYPVVLEREMTLAELVAWNEVIFAELRARVAWQFLSCGERHDRFSAETAPPVNHWSELSATWQERILSLADSGYLRRQGGTWPGYLQGLYQDLLQRTASPPELTSWRLELFPLQREHLVGVLLDRRRQLRSSTFTGLPAGELRLP
ncbi:MAG: hypothetical protein ABIF77_10020 [bacterium]